MLQLKQPDGVITEFSSVTNATVEIVKQTKKPFMANCGATAFLQKDEVAVKSLIEFDTGCRVLAEVFEKLGVSR